MTPRAVPRGETSVGFTTFSSPECPADVKFWLTSEIFLTFLWRKFQKCAGIYKIPTTWYFYTSPNKKRNWSKHGLCQVSVVSMRSSHGHSFGLYLSHAIDPPIHTCRIPFLSGEVWGHWRNYLWHVAEISEFFVKNSEETVIFLSIIIHLSWILGNRMFWDSCKPHHCGFPCISSFQ